MTLRVELVFHRPLLGSASGLTMPHLTINIRLHPLFGAASGWTPPLPIISLDGPPNSTLPSPPLGYELRYIDFIAFTFGNGLRLDINAGKHSTVNAVRRPPSPAPRLRTRPACARSRAFIPFLLQR
jgi:hypothetical protein